MRALLTLVLCALALAVPAVASASPGEASFTPTSLRVPIWRIALQGSGDGAPPRQDLYQCAGPHEDDCLVDFADDAALAALFRGATSIAPGVYDRIEVYLCPDGTVQAPPGGADYHVRLRGQVTLGELVNALNALGASPRDLISIFQALKRAGALNAELIVM